MSIFLRVSETLLIFVAVLLDIKMENNNGSNAFDLPYIKRLRSAFNTIGLWPNKHLGSNNMKSKLLSTYKWSLIMLCFWGVIFQAIYMVKRKDNLEFIDLGHSYVPILMSFVFMQRCILSAKDIYGDLTAEFILKFHLIHHKNMSDISFKIYNTVNKYCAIATVIVNLQMIIGPITFNIMPVYHNYKSGMYSFNRPVNGTFDHSIFFELPVDQYKDFHYYFLIFIYNIFISYNTACAFCCYDLFICLKVLHIWGHFNILLHNLEYFPRPKKIQNLAYSNEEINEITIKLKNVIKHHKFIKDFIDLISSTYSFDLCVLYAYHLVTGCVLLLECSTLDPEALGKYGVLTLISLIQLVQISVIFEVINTKGNSIGDAVYGLPWELMDNSNKKTVLLFLQRVQQPLSLKAADMVPVGVTTMAQILKTSCSCYIMLKAFAKE